MIAPRKLDSSIAISVGNFSGKVGLMDMYVIGSMEINGDESLQFLAWNINFYHKKRPLAFIKRTEKYKGLFAGISTQCFNSKDPDCGGLIIADDVNVNVKNTDNFFETMTTALRSAIPMEYVIKPPGITNFYLSRVAISARYKTGIAFIK